MRENPEYLKKQILTYLGNKRSLLKYIDNELKEISEELCKEKMITLDLFSGSGVVARLMKQYSSCIIANDLEKYSAIINQCYLSNKNDIDIEKYNFYMDELNSAITSNPVSGIMSSTYSPKDDNNIQEGERVFYTSKNALIIDSARYYIEQFIPEEYKSYFLARLLIEASIHANTSGVFKGFYKDKATGIGRFGGSGDSSLERIKGEIDISKPPVLSNFSSDYKIYSEDANLLARKLNNIDVAYLDPPYNEHPYGSNYFMLNVILNNQDPKDISKVAGIPKEWHRSEYNKKKEALASLEDLILTLDANYIIVSYNNEGFISLEQMEAMLKRYGSLKTVPIEYNAFRGSRNLKNRSLKTNEYLFVLKKCKS